MVEYILGIGSLTDQECQEVFREVSKRKEGMIQAQATITKEVNVLNTIQFQVAQRRKELHNASKENKEKALCYFCNDNKGFETLGIPGKMKCSSCGKIVEIEKCFAENIKKNYCAECGFCLYWNTKEDTWYCQNPLCIESQECQMNYELWKMKKS